MFERLKKVLTAEKSETLVDAGTGRELDLDLGIEVAVFDTTGQLAGRPRFDWNAAHQSFFKTSKGGSAFTLSGRVDGKPWKFERATTPRDYIRGEELRARADVDVNPEVSVLVMNRVLKESLEKRAYALYTDTLETQASPALIEEMRWLALYPEVGWDQLALSFWQRYSVMTSSRADAMKWLTPELTALLMQWPEPPPGADVPFMLMLMRGNMHLRMQWSRANAHWMPHTGKLLINASRRAIASFPCQASNL